MTWQFVVLALGVLAVLGQSMFRILDHLDAQRIRKYNAEVERLSDATKNMTQIAQNAYRELDERLNKRVDKLDSELRQAGIEAEKGMHRRLDGLKEQLREEREKGDKTLAESVAEAMKELTVRTNKLEMEVFNER